MNQLRSVQMQPDSVIFAASDGSFLQVKKDTIKMIADSLDRVSGLITFSDCRSCSQQMDVDLKGASKSLKIERQP